MGDKIGKPISVEHGQPRVLPKTAPRPNPLPEQAPVKKEVTAMYEYMVGVLQVAIYQATRRNVKNIAEFFGIAPHQVVVPLIVACVSVMVFCDWLMTGKSKKDLTDSFGAEYNRRGG